MGKLFTRLQRVETPTETVTSITLSEYTKFAWQISLSLLRWMVLLYILKT